MDWLTNPYGIGYIGVIVFVVGTIGAIAFGIMGALHAMWHQREKRDGKK